ncbi:hypothetical protein FIBSPDRAFT_1047087 [Athelia psychrophila]|uniref:YWTD domain-containing protein n=1 Tax=Athelia psychrophila TaxID=1759441 RepID=A0A166FTT6_9AGAM|nr:hypothetical protein FIBSPDRAFT_1047087 [Fibularhizoctonia sp. CBS 109695]
MTTGVPVRGIPTRSNINLFVLVFHSWLPLSSRPQSVGGPPETRANDDVTANPVDDRNPITTTGTTPKSQPSLPPNRTCWPPHDSCSISAPPSATPDGQDIRILSTLADGVVVDTRHGKGRIYVTCMGYFVSTNDGRLVRAAGDGTGVEVIVPDGATFTPKQLVIDMASEKLCWADREGMRTDEDRKDSTRTCVGVSVDTTELSSFIYVWWGASKAHQGRILRANIDIPPNQTIQTLYAHLPEPIDLDLDPASQTLYWTDRGDPPLGNTLNRADVSAHLAPTAGAKGPGRDTVVVGKLHEAIALSLDLPGRRALVADLNGPCMRWIWTAGGRRYWLRMRRRSRELFTARRRLAWSVIWA